ncbi:hypothetical protein [Vibrio nomapromontoriensis]|uniref:hypothetical protein n=1 Tax=Vibrio nomapromontoriensis TaxID=2910246 RepID=UPI003D117709
MAFSWLLVGCKSTPWDGQGVETVELVVLHKFEFKSLDKQQEDILIKKLSVIDLNENVLSINVNSTNSLSKQKIEAVIYNVLGNKREIIESTSNNDRNTITIESVSRDHKRCQPMKITRNDKYLDCYTESNRLTQKVN